MSKKIKETTKDLQNKIEEKVVEEKKELVRYFDISYKEGLDDEKVQDRNERGLVNVVSSTHGKSIGKIFADNIFTFFNMLYLVVTVLLIYARSWKNLSFLIVIIPNTIIGIIQEIKSKKMIDKLSLVSAPLAKVVRNGVEINIDTKEVVLDDIIRLSTGDQIYADSIVVDGDVEVNESLITGEGDAIGKVKNDKLFSGSFIVGGTCYARVDHVGKDNYIEKLASEARKHQPPKSELLRSLKTIIKAIAFIIVPLGALTFYITYQHSIEPTINLKIIEAIKTMSATVIGMIPSGLFLLTSTALAVGVVNLGRNKTLVQELYCIEMLARVNVLCLDKTGTITDGTMRVVDCVEVKNYTDYTVREIVGSMMSAFIETNPTSEALIKYFDKNHVLTSINAIPFNSKRKFSAVTFVDTMTKTNVGTFFLGAPEFVLTDQYEKARPKVERFASQGCRVLALGHTTGQYKEGQTKSVKAIALIVIQDHIREEAYSTIEYFKNNGVDIKVISGDNPLTVSEIANRAGIQNANRFISLEGLSDEEVKEIAFEYTIFGRVTPSQKKALVEALKEQKRTVAMTGDGVNDILALKEADCSIAMASGSEATRYVSHLVLTDSNFSSMPKVVAEGRRVINNIQKSSTLFLTKTIFTILLTIMYLIFQSTTNIGQGYPFEASQFILIEFCAIGVPATMLALQPNMEQVKGRFLPNVLKSTLPGALTVVVFHAALYFLIPTMGWTSNTYSTIALIVTTTICFLVLYKVCKPFNWWKTLVYLFVLALCLAMIFCSPLIDKLQTFFNFATIEGQDFWFLLAAMEATYPIWMLISGLFNHRKRSRSF